MDQQFEHLSDAQIENYGDRTGAGPNQSDHSLDEAIEGHLEACDGCRTRVLEFHRARIGLMNERAAQQTQFSPDGVGNPAPTVREVPGSASLEHGISAAASRAPSASHRSPDCPTEDALRDLAAGLSSADAAAHLTQHAAQCDHCGPILRAYTEDFSYDLSPEDQSLLTQLNSASPSWQKKIAARMAEAATTRPESSRSMSPIVERSARKVDGVAQPGSPASPVLAGRGGEPPSAVQEKISPPPKSSRFHLPSLKWILVPAAAIATAVIAFFIWNAQHETPQKVEKLLAQAYTEQRTMEMRIPYAAHADFKQTRGDTASLLSSPAALRRATDIIAANLKKNPDDPQWLLLSARLDLLDWRYQSSLSTLNKIDDEKVEDSPAFRLIQSLALYEKAEIEHDPQSYGQVVELLGKTLQKAPDDPVALFNQALACEKLYMYECASGDYEHFLKIDGHSGWSAEAREHLNRIKEKKTPEQ